MHHVEKTGFYDILQIYSSYACRASLSEEKQRPCNFAFTGEKGKRSHGAKSGEKVG